MEKINVFCINKSVFNCSNNERHIQVHVATFLLAVVAGVTKLSPWPCSWPANQDKYSLMWKLLVKTPSYALW